MNEIKNDVVRLNISIPIEVWQELKILAIHEKKTLQDLVSEWVAANVKERREAA